MDDKATALAQATPPHHIFGVDTIGIMNGLVDLSIQVPQLVQYPVNNTYGLELLNATFAAQLSAEADVCLAQSRECDRVLEETGYDALGGEPMPGVCFAGAICWNAISEAFDAVARVGLRCFFTLFTPSACSGCKVCVCSLTSARVLANHSATPLTSRMSCPTASRIPYT